MSNKSGGISPWSACICCTRGMLAQRRERLVLCARLSESSRSVDQRPRAESRFARKTLSAGHCSSQWTSVSGVAREHRVQIAVWSSVSIVANGASWRRKTRTCLALAWRLRKGDGGVSGCRRAMYDRTLCESYTARDSCDLACSKSCCYRRLGHDGESI